MISNIVKRATDLTGGRFRPHMTVSAPYAFVFKPLFAKQPGCSRLQPADGCANIEGAESRKQMYVSRLNCKDLSNDGNCRNLVNNCVADKFLLR